MVNPNNSGGNVEKWLVEVEVMMKKSLAYSIDSSMVDHSSSDRMDWVQKWPGQARAISCFGNDLGATCVFFVHA